LSRKVLSPNRPQHRIARFSPIPALLSVATSVFVGLDTGSGPKSALVFLAAFQAIIALVFLGNTSAAAFANTALGRRGKAESLIMTVD